MLTTEPRMLTKHTPPMSCPQPSPNLTQDSISTVVLSLYTHQHLICIQLHDLPAVVCQGLLSRPGRSWTIWARRIETAIAFLMFEVAEGPLKQIRVHSSCFKKKKTGACSNTTLKFTSNRYSRLCSVVVGRRLSSSFTDTRGGEALLCMAGVSSAQLRKASSSS